MQDRFKFRIWDLKHNLMIKPEEERSDQDMTIIGKTYNYDEWYGSAELELTDSLRYFDDKPFVIMQCTGLKDTNDKLIYEKDIIKCSYGNVGALGVVEWDFENMQFVLKIKENFYSFSPKTIYEKIEILGNIYENPELLEVNSET